MNRAVVICVSVLVLALVVAMPASAQDTQYWTLHYGTRGDLLGGLVIGTFLDLSASYYNPGALALIDNASLILSGQAFELQNITIDSDNTLTSQLSSLRFGPAPSLFAGSFNFNKWGLEKLVYSFLTRQRFDFRLSAEADGIVDVSSPPGPEEVSSQIYFDQRMAEYWAGLSGGWKLNDNLGIGTSLYGVYRSQSIREETNIFAASTTTPESRTNSDISDTRYWHTRLLAKFGIAWAYQGFDFGFSATTPSLAAFGSGSVFHQIALFGFDVDGDSIPDPLLATSTQHSLATDYRSSWALGAGASFEFQKWSVYVSAEWFNAVTKFAIMTPEPFTPANIPKTIDPTVDQALNSVFNFGVGAERAFTETFGLSFSIISDKTAFNPESDVSISDWNMLQLNTGFWFQVGTSKFTLGFSYAQGKGQTSSLINIEKGNDGNLLQGSFVPLDVKYQRATLVVGFQFPL